MLPVVPLLKYKGISMKKMVFALCLLFLCAATASGTSSEQTERSCLYCGLNPAEAGGSRSHPEALPAEQRTRNTPGALPIPEPKGHWRAPRTSRAQSMAAAGPIDCGKTGTSQHTVKATLGASVLRLKNSGLSRFLLRIPEATLKLS